MASNRTQDVGQEPGRAPSKTPGERCLTMLGTAVVPAGRLTHGGAADPRREDGRPFFVHRPEDQFYASTTGWPWDCPQPDLGLVPTGRTDYRIEAQWDPRDADDRDVERARFCWQHVGGQC